MAEKNYTKIDNDYFLHLSSFDLNGSEFRVLLFLLRQTICYKRTYTKECSYSFIAGGTGLSDASVKRAIKKLIDDDYIEICNTSTNKKAKTYQLRVVKLGFLGGQTWMFRVVKDDQKRGTKLTTKEITGDNSIEIKDKERTSSNFSTNYYEPERKLTDEEIRKLGEEDEEEEGYEYL